MAGYVSCIIRFGCHIPTGMMGFDGRSLDETAKGIHDLDVFPHGDIFKQGLHVVHIAGIATFSWNFAMFVISPMCSGPLLAAIGVVDLALAAALLAGIAEQSRFLPRSYAPCHQAADWKNGTDGRNFFVDVSSSVNKTTTESPSAVCNSMVHNWALTIGVVVVYVLCGSINVLFGACTSDFRRPSRYPSTSFRFLPSTRRGYRFSSAGFLSSLRRHEPFRTVFALLDLVVSPCLYMVRYLFKFVQKTKARNEIRLKTARTRKQQPCEEKGISPPLRPLPFDIRVLISPQLHFADLVSVSRSSKLLRWRILGEAGAESSSLEDLCQFTCNAADRTQCYICDMQICSTCSTQVAVQESSALRHLKTCRPYCRKCFYSFGRQWKTGEGFRTTQHHTSCRLSANCVLPNHTSSQRAVCRFCAFKARNEREQMLEARDRQEARRLARLPLACDRCKVVLPSTGPRWWVCTSCSAECTDHIHPPWAKS